MPKEKIIDISLSEEERKKFFEELEQEEPKAANPEIDFEISDEFSEAIKAERKSVSQKRIPLWNDGFVDLVEISGADQIIDNDATISTGKAYNDELQEVRTPGERRSLLRYLTRKRHTSPLEMGTVKFHIRMPLFVMRQFVRHRTASLNEYSGRYSEMIDSLFIPNLEDIRKQSDENNQGSEEALDPVEAERAIGHILTSFEVAKNTYEMLLDMGVAREVARIVLPVANYTEVVWKINLHNFFHFAKLRTDKDAQKEIQDLANAMVELAEPHFPVLFEAWRDYVKESYTLSRMEKKALSALLKDGMLSPNPKKYGMSKREYAEFKEFLQQLKEI